MASRPWRASVATQRQPSPGFRSTRRSTASSAAATRCDDSTKSPTAHLPSTPEWEIKCALSLHLWLDAEHVSAIRSRIAEMREPPLHLDAVPDERLRASFEELLRCDGSAELLAGIYGAARSEIVAAIDDHLRMLNPLFDFPTHRLLRTVVREQREMLEWGQEALAAVCVSDAMRRDAERFETHIRSYLASAGGICGTRERPQAADAVPPARWDGTPFEMHAMPRRDARFIDPFNATAKIDEYYKDESLPTDERTWALACKRLREMDVPEWMAPILFKTREKPWEYYREMSRQLWDEARHAMMGEVSLVSLGIPFYAYPIDWAASVSLNTEFTPLEAHLILWRIEQDLMPGGSGKRYEWSRRRTARRPVLHRAPGLRLGGRGASRADRPALADERTRAG